MVNRAIVDDEPPPPPKRPAAVTVRCWRCRQLYEECAYEGPCRHCGRGSPDRATARCPNCGAPIYGEAAS